MESHRKQRGTRILQACDACRARKIKCKVLPTNRRCQGCASLDIGCTHSQPRRRRGPPNKFARSTIQGRQVSGQNHDSSVSSFSDFASEAVVLDILQSWFDQIHPVIPILHRRHFMERINAGESQTNPAFYGAVLGVCAATIATLPRREFGSITAQACIDYIYQKGLVQGGFEKCLYSLDWCISMYTIAIALATISRSHLTMMRAYHALTEAFAGVRYLAFFSMQDLDFLEQQLLIRLFWVLFAGSCSAHLFGKLQIGLLSFTEVRAFARPLPLTDKQLASASSSASAISGGSAWHDDDISYIPGLNFLSELYMVWHEAQSVPAQSDVSAYLQKIEQIVNDLPPELRWRGGLSRLSTAAEGHDIQIANLFISSLHIRSKLVRKLGSTAGQHGQQELILNDLSQILSHLPDSAFNANGSSMISKIRDIGAAYLEELELTATTTSTTNLGNEKMTMILRRLDDLDCWNNVHFIAHP